MRGRLELHVQFEYRCAEPFGLHVGIARACLAKKFGARLFEPHGVNGVVDYSHLVGFRVTDFDSRGMCVGTSFHGGKYTNVQCVSGVKKDFPPVYK